MPTLSRDTTQEILELKAKIMVLEQAYMTALAERANYILMSSLLRAKLSQGDNRISSLEKVLREAPIGLPGESNSDMCAKYYKWFEGQRKQILGEI